MTVETLDIGLVEVVKTAYNRAFSVQSDYARANADFVAMAACMGLITTRVHRNVFSRDWRPTVKGLMLLEGLQLTDDNELEDFSDAEDNADDIHHGA